MASLNKLAIRGIRSFDDKNIAVIEFFSPVTVIVGHNGSGKTTIIECLKYATTGDQPPNSRGGAFVHDPKMANEKEVKAQVKLRFNAANGQRMLAVRNLSVTMKKTAGLTMKTLESILSLADGNPNGKRATISTKCAEIDTEIPNLLGVSKAVLENVIFCHQEESYWPLAEPAALKKKFDDIFEATRYTKALDSIKSLRKERVLDLKVDKERLESLSKEKAHADKLKARLNELQNSINMKEMRHEQIRRECDQLILANKQFYESATKFREKYIEIQHLEADNARFTVELQDVKLHIKEMTETDEELTERRRNFDQDKRESEKKYKEQKAELQAALEELERSRKTLMRRREERGGLEAEAKKYESDVEERDKEVHRIAERLHIPGFETTPYSREALLQFKAQLDELLRKSSNGLETYKEEVSRKLAGFRDDIAKLRTEHKLMEQQRLNLNERIASLQATISNSESARAAGQSLPRELSAIRTDIEDKEKRIEKIRAEIKDARYDDRTRETESAMHTMEEQRAVLDTEFKKLNLQADSRAKLDIKRAELTKRQRDQQLIVDVNSSRFEKVIGAVFKHETIERDVDRVISVKEKEVAEAEEEYNNANTTAKQVEASITAIQNQVKGKRSELKDLDAQITARLADSEKDTIQDAIREAEQELDWRRTSTSSLDEKKRVYELLLTQGKAMKKCTVCNRGMNDHEIHEFEKNLSKQIGAQNSSGPNLKEEAEDWESELTDLRSFLSIEVARDTLKQQDLPNLQRQLGEEEAKLPGCTALRDKVRERLESNRLDMKELQALKQQSVTLTELQSSICLLEKDIARLEEDLSTTGSVKTADSLENERADIDVQMQKLKKESVALVNDKEQQVNRLRRQQDDLSALKLQENSLAHKVQEHEALHLKISTYHQEMKDASDKVKDVTEKVRTVLDPLERIQVQHDRDKDESLTETRRKEEQHETIRRSTDLLTVANRNIEAYVRGKRAKLLEQSIANIAEIEEKIVECKRSVEDIRESMSKREKEIHESDSFLSNLRENERLRRLRKAIEENKSKINAFDMEEAARARRQFDEKYAEQKKKEGDMEAEYARLGGELNTLKDSLNTTEKDLADYKDTHKQYTQQLIKVKMSDMANNDLEKYAKALDNAIMKYHGLKMEEVNDTMRYLWNKTYQGTDIDGIRIRSDAEGGASKRSYNYRVVMTKDQVEMDMRGRCSAGQKMLASIIIRLALSDSFGQNCGILALDEPTNALDVENIDALAGSLVDIINERKNHANFQLIIITHDENFLRKLEQANVMEYYWRVSRDARQKSIIERQRVG